MQIVKTFHFYAAHRNETLRDKCNSIHGHVYRLRLHFRVVRSESNENISTLFEDFDRVDRFLKRRYDHALIANTSDAVMFTVKDAMGSDLPQKFAWLLRPTSAENLCFDIFHRIVMLGFDLAELHIQETESSTVIYTTQDYFEDKKRFEGAWIDA